jgi:dihydrolipoamide dehydrogenase
VILGAGPGGYIAALRAGLQGAKVAVVEKSHLGGTCLNNGCIPSKAILATAELLHSIDHAKDMGVKVSGKAKVDWPGVQKRKDKVLNTLRTGIKGLFRSRKVDLHSGTGKLISPGKVAVLDADGAKTAELTADKVILAVGSEPARIPGWPDDPQLVCTTDEALHWDTLPKKLLIVGGGVIGCEFACMTQPMGVEVTIVEMMPKLLPGIDDDIAQAMQKTLEGRGITVLTDTKVEDLAAKGKGAVATLSGGNTVEVDRVLVSVGRRAATEDIGLDAVGLETDRGFLRVDDRMQTPLAGHYCIGDANGRVLLAHAASAQGVVAVTNALGGDALMDAPVPSAVYTFPEIGAVGLSAEQARDKGMPITIGTFPLAALGKAMAAGHTEGFVKVIRHRETDELLGVHMIGHNATESAAAAVALLHTRASVHDLAEAVIAHPTISESLKEAAEDALHEALHLPAKKVLRLAAAI